MTLVIASYNHAAYVRDAISSLAAQTFAGYELIVTDDASRDGSVQAIDDALHEFDIPARRLFSQQNQGICRTFNSALSHVTTPYVAFLAADDWMEPERLAMQVAALDDEPTAGLAYSDMWIGDPDLPARSQRYSQWWGDEWRTGDNDDLFRDLVAFNWIPAPTVMSRTQALRDVGGYDESLAYEDHDMWLRLARRWSFAYVDRPLVTWRRVAGSLSAQLDQRDARTTRRHDLYMLGKHVGEQAEIDEWLEPRVFHLAVEELKLGNRSPELARVLRRCLRSSPGPSRLRPAVHSSVASVLARRPTRTERQVR